MPRRILAAVLAATVVVGLGGCGVVRSGGATDEGNAAVVGAVATDAERKDPPSPNSASSAEGLVSDFLRAAVGGLKPVDQVKAFLTPRALESFREPPSPENPALTVIRLTRQPTTGAASDGRIPVSLEYQVVGQLTDQGRVDNLVDPVSVPMRFWVVPDEHNRSNLRVDQIEPALPGLLLSDEALTEYYRVQPVYFWDQNYSVLVPDVRYVPLTITPDQRANRLVNWLVAGPSAGLTGSVQGLPLGTSTDSVLSDAGLLTVKLSAEAGAGGPDGLRRLLFQLQWTLRTSTTPKLQLKIDDKVEQVPAQEDEYLRYNLSYNFRGLPQRYDVSERKVVALPVGSPVTGALAADANSSVVTAAVARNGAAAAYVRLDQNNRQYLQIAREAGTIDTTLAHGTSIGRPAFVPDSGDTVLVVSAGRLYAVSGRDGTATDVTRTGGGVGSVSVSPDGRRVAFVANGQAYVSSLTVVNNTVTVGTNLRPILAGQLAASAVAWTGESWLDVAGTSPSGGPALWRVTADSVVAQDLSESLKGVLVRDLVAYPQWPARTNTDVLAVTEQGIYSFFSSLTQEGSLRAPFFGTCPPVT